MADPDSAKLILSIPDDPYVNHNGGTIRFGPDGYLYWTTGDGGLAGDPYDNAQNVAQLLRQDPPHRRRRRRRASPTRIPADNPFATTGLVSSNPFGDRGRRRPTTRARGAEIWAYGLRNPWQFSFDSETGDLYIADVGQNAWEEINFQPAGSPGGQNYGWDWLEGSHCYPETVTECPRGQVGVLPVAEYDHSAGRLLDHRPRRLPHARNRPPSTASTSPPTSAPGRVWGLARDDAGAWQFQELLDTELLVTGGGNDEAGAVYLTSCSACSAGDYDPFTQSHGVLWRIVQADMVPEGATTVDTAGTPSAEAADAGERKHDRHGDGGHAGGVRRRRGGARGHGRTGRHRVRAVRAHHRGEHRRDGLAAQHRCGAAHLHDRGARDQRRGARRGDRLGDDQRAGRDLRVRLHRAGP